MVQQWLYVILIGVELMTMESLDGTLYLIKAQNQSVVARMLTPTFMSISGGLRIFYNIDQKLLVNLIPKALYDRNIRL